MKRPGPENRWRTPWWRRLSWRAVAAIATALFLFGYPIYIYMDSLVTGGITRQGDLLVVNLQAMSSFAMDQDAGTTADIPSRYRQLDGKRVLLAGQMWEPYTAAGKIRAFTLVYSISNCCFNGPPLVQHLVQASVGGGQEVEYSPDFVDVVGTLHVGVQSGEGKVRSVYRIDVEKVRRD